MVIIIAKKSHFYTVRYILSIFWIKVVPRFSKLAT